MTVDLAQGAEAGNGTGAQARSESVSRREEIVAALIDIEERGVIPDIVADQPGAFLLAFYKAWVENGGQDGGKNRNSIRRMRDVWLTGDAEVKSLHPKLTGRIRVSREDAASLISLFLARWQFMGGGRGDQLLTSDGYASFPSEDHNKLSAELVVAMYPEASEQARIGLLLPAQGKESLSESIESTLKELYEPHLDAEAVVVLRRHNSVVGSTPVESMQNFWHAMRYLYDHASNDNLIFIWIVDIGSRRVEEEGAWREFFNFEILKSQLRAFVTFDASIDDEAGHDEKSGTYSAQERSAIHDAFLRHLTIPELKYRDRRWQWLCERSVFAVQNLRLEEFEDLYQDEDKMSKKFRFRDTGVTAEHVLPNEIPYAWGQQKGSQDLFKGRIDKFVDATITIFLGAANSDGAEGSKQAPPLRYFAHAPVAGTGRGWDRQWPTSSISREMVSPGASYDEAYRIVYWAACHRLGLAPKGDAVYRENCAIALAYLARLGFRMLRLPEFLKIHRTPSD